VWRVISSFIFKRFQKINKNKKQMLKKKEKKDAQNSHLK
jgi:hypothetical protein